MPEVYIRNQDGDTRDCTLEEGLKEFLDNDNGYRISFFLDNDVTITLRRGMVVDDDMKELDSRLSKQVSLTCAVTIRGYQ